MHSIILAAFILLAGPAFVLPLGTAAAGSFEDGAAAEARGDFKTAFKFYRAASKQGSDEANLAIGKLYLNNRGVKKDPKTALKWFRRSADGGNVTAQRLMGVMYDGSMMAPRA